MLLSKSSQHPNGIGNSTRPRRPQLLRAPHGPGVTGLVKDLVGKPHTHEDGRPGGFYVPRFRNLKDKQPDFIRGYGFEGEGGKAMFPDRHGEPGFGKAYKKEVRDYAGAFINMGGFGEVLPRYENASASTPRSRTRGASRSSASTTSSATTRRRWPRTWQYAEREMFEAAGIEIIGVDKNLLTQGWSIHELGTARMGTIRRPPC